MENTLGAFKAQQSKSLEILKKLGDFLQMGAQVGVQIDPSVQHKLDTAAKAVAGEKLKVALVGGFSDGKTSIAAAWMEKLDKSTMKISHQESSNEVRVYEVQQDFVLIDTPGLFGFKEQVNAETHALEKYKDITKKYVSEAHLILYVMDPTNPIKQSHQDDLMWLFRTLNLLPRTVFVLSRFDEVADVEDEHQYMQNLAVKQDNVRSRLAELIDLRQDEAAQLSIVGVAANPFDLGTEHWLSNLEQFKALSHIGLLQAATSAKIAANGGAPAIVDETKKSVIRDVLSKQLPVAIENDKRIANEVDKLENMSVRLQKQLLGANSQIADARRSLRDFVIDYFADLILQAKGVNMDTFSDFFEREVGSNGIMVSTRLQNEFERQLKSVTQEISNMKIGFDAEVNHFNSTVTQFGKQGLDYLVKSKVINNTTVLATRDGIVTAARYMGIDLGKMLNFKPWGATNLAKGVNGALAVVGLALEAWDSWEQAKRREEFQKAMAKMVENFEKQREELVQLLDGPRFIEQFFAGFLELKADVENVRENVEQQRTQRQRFREWREMGEAIDVQFREVAA
ncbi:LeoA/HP0731 family dynamin-like GTPase [Massilia arenae]|uniref:Labile enterotoxin output A n=1 Tax=Massilia arenae TaxID=2603288 RepID=A0A5C7FSG5_9BURK|nr:LeoA/HP0731 family dynamin-like GTPase [Massilia arenae]TXF97944.1 labile enterotoxin output A [Massilia arenae]